ncbi:MAG TPA: hypothetical protein PLY87_06290 [Planctomycetaceae bacterium]|nr:hypothetical protein [Planctomycetaceae bacterium]HQZ64662.1 hypothetical protein [Planctomycetaceae bacterium]HRA86844.1 hypothetical protein [Planctomycetaceae bacterium]
MSDQPDDLNSHLQREFQRRSQKSEALSVRPNAELITTEKIEEPPTPPSKNRADVELEQMGMINRLRLRHAESAHQLERARLAYRTEMQVITHQSDAAIRESRAFWDAKSVEVAETIKTYVQATVRALEIDRLDSRNADLQRAYESAAAAMEKARSAKLPEVLKDRLIRDMLDNFERTLTRIQNDTIVSKYDLD